MSSSPLRVSTTRAGTSGSYDDPAGNHPCTSTTRFTSTFAPRQTDPSAPTRAITALATVPPAGAFTFDASGRSAPHGHTVTKPASAGSVTVTFNATATASAGTPCRPATGNRSTSPARIRADGDEPGTVAAATSQAASGWPVART